MSFLDQISDKEKETLISLPYRVGLYVSLSDESGGDDASEQELQTLSNIIDGFARDVFGAEMIQYIMAETVKHKNRWPVWALQINNVPDDCLSAMETVRVHGDEKDVTAFQNHMMEIGEAVAMAFSEYEEQSGFSQSMLRLRFFVSGLIGSLQKNKKRSAREFMSVSLKERRALGDLAQALGTTY